MKVSLEKWVWCSFGMFGVVACHNPSSNHPTPPTQSSTPEEIRPLEQDQKIPPPEQKLETRETAEPDKVKPEPLPLGEMKFPSKQGESPKSGSRESTYMNLYMGAVHVHFHDRFSEKFNTISEKIPAEAKDSFTTIRIEIDFAGNLVDAKIVKPSGIEALDQASYKSLKEIKKFDLEYWSSKLLKAGQKSVILWKFHANPELGCNPVYAHLWVESVDKK